MKRIGCYLFIIALSIITKSCEEFPDNESDTDFDVEEVKFFFEEKILSGKILEIQVNQKLTEPQVFLNGDAVNVEIEDNTLSDNDTSISDTNEKRGYFLKIKIPESYKGEYHIRVSAGIADYPDSQRKDFDAGKVKIYRMEESKDFEVGRPAYASVEDAILLIETARGEDHSNLNGYPGYKITEKNTVEKIECLDYKRETLSDAEIYGFKTISDKYCFSYMTYVSNVDTIYQDYTDFVAIQQPVEVTYPVIIRSADGLLIPLQSYYENENPVFSDQIYEAQFRCYEENTFYFMPDREYSSGFSNKPIYKIEIDVSQIPTDGYVFKEEDEYLSLRSGVEITEVYDGSCSVFNGESRHWVVDADGSILLNESQMVINHRIMNISPSNYSGSLIGTPSVFRTPNGSILAMRGTSNGPQTEYISPSLKWNVHYQYFELGLSPFTVVTLSNGKLYFTGTNRYYVLEKNNDIDSGKDYSPSIDKFHYYNNLYPYQEHYIYAFKAGDLYRIKLSNPSEQELIYSGLQESDISYFGVLKDRVVIVDIHMKVVIITDGKAECVDASDLEVWGNPMAIVR